MERASPYTLEILRQLSKLNQRAARAVRAAKKLQAPRGV